ncbi:hypothetical protein [Sulfobacillus sp. hq2]|uniref:hypothetical protein n=1 Tax=Sulfobacillus TaxID=28033 RepID=UPI000CD29D8D|nr:hypothetical protein [Sulfobacillus sp. hq2]POB10100.1 hypothetical protein CO251_11480 [Sulfobacillus sp. hq2]
MKTLRCIITGWVAPDEAQEWIGIDPTDSGRGWGLAYRRDPDTGAIATEWWHWRETANEEGKMSSTAQSVPYTATQEE